MTKPDLQTQLALARQSQPKLGDWRSARRKRENCRRLEVEIARRVRVKRDDFPYPF